MKRKRERSKPDLKINTSPDLMAELNRKQELIKDDPPLFFKDLKHFPLLTLKEELEKEILRKNDKEDLIKKNLNGRFHLEKKFTDNLHLTEDRAYAKNVEPYLDRHNYEQRLKRRERMLRLVFPRIFPPEISNLIASHEIPYVPKPY